MTWVIIIAIIIGVVFFINKMNSWENLYDTGLNCYRRKDYKNAMTYLEKAIEKNPHNPEILGCYADCCLQQGMQMKKMGLDSVSLFLKKKSIRYFIKSLKISYNFDIEMKIKATIIEEDNNEARYELMKELETSGFELSIE